MIYTSTRSARFNIGHRLGLDAGEGRCDWGKVPPARGMQLDILGLHEATCAWHTNRHRHDELRDHLAQYARSGGVTATIEQAWPADDAPRHARCVHVRLMDADANTTWIDVMVTAAQPARPITENLREAERERERER